MATKTSIESQQKRLKLKSEQLNARVKIQEYKDKHVQLTKQLKVLGGRVR